MVQEGTDAYAQLVARAGMKSPPQVFIDSLPVGGYHETLCADRAGMPDGLLVDWAGPAVGADPRRRPTMFSEAMRDVIVYTTEACSFCTRVKGLLRSQEIDFEEIDLAGDPEGVIALAEKTGMMTMPQVTVGGILVGGYDETADAAASGRLAELMLD